MKRRSVSFISLDNGPFYKSQMIYLNSRRPKNNSQQFIVADEKCGLT